MARLIWDKPNEKTYALGIAKAVLYPEGADGVAWNGLSSVTEKPVEDESFESYVDGVKVGQASSKDEFAATIEAVTYPDEFEECDGTAEMAPGVLLGKQTRKSFGLSYQTRVCDDVSGEDLGYKIHLVYGAYATPTDKDYLSFGATAEPSAFSWDISTIPQQIPGRRATAHLFVDSTKTRPELLADFEELLYGTDSTPPQLPTAEEVEFFFFDWCVLRITDNGDGTWTATGPDEAFSFPDATTFEITWDSAVYLDADTYTISSL